MLERTSNRPHPLISFRRKPPRLLRVLELLGEDDAGGHREEVVWLDSLQVPRLACGKVDRHSAPLCGAPLCVGACLQGAVGENHCGNAAFAEIEIDAAGEEESGDVLIWRVSSTRPDQIALLALAFEFGADYGFGAVVGEPGRVADDYVYGVGAEGDGADQVAGVVGPDVVASVGVEAGEEVGGAFEHGAIGTIGNADIVERLARVAALLEFFGNAGHEVIEPVALFDQRPGEFEAEVAFKAVIAVVDGDRHGAAGEHIGGFGAQLERVAEVNGDGHIVRAGVAGAFERFAGGESPGGAGEMHGGGVYVDAGDVGEQSVEYAVGLAPRRAGGGEILANGGEDERAGAAGGIEHALVEWIGDDSVDDFAGEPVGSVILAEPPTVVGGNHGFVEDAGDIGLGAGPIEAGDAAGESAQPRAAFDFGRPGEEIGLDDAAHAGFVNEELAVEQLGGIALRVLDDINAEGGLQRERDDGGKVGVAQEQVVEVVLALDHLAQRGGEQLPPEAALNRDGGLIAPLLVQLAQRLKVLLETRAGTESLAHLLVVGSQSAALQRLRLVAQPFVEVVPALGILKGEGVGRRGAPVGGAGAAQQPVLAVGEDAEARRFAVGGQRAKILVELSFVIVSGLESGTDPALDLNHKVVGLQVDPAAAGLAFHLDIGAAGKLGGDQKVAQRAADVGLRGVVGVTLEQRLSGAAEDRTFRGDLARHRASASSAAAWLIELFSQ